MRALSPCWSRFARSQRLSQSRSFGPTKRANCAHPARNPDAASSFGLVADERSSYWTQLVT
jgi:hypothetical protein